jgi:hypothetical protein
MVAQVAAACDDLDTGESILPVRDRSPERWFCEKLEIRKKSGATRVS